MEGYGEVLVLYQRVETSKWPFNGWYPIKLQEHLTQKEGSKRVTLIGINDLITYD